MFLRAYLEELLASASPYSLILAASFLTAAIAIVGRFLSKSSENDSPIPLYTPETRAVGNYQKRWSYDNPNTLREAYSKVRDPLRFLSESQRH